MWDRERVSILSSPPVTSDLPASRWRRYDRRDARQIPSTAAALGFDHVEFREGLAERLPVEDGWADVVISNGVINLCANKRSCFHRNRARASTRRVPAIRGYANGQPGP